ncbi:AAA family ATPase [Aeromonas veronii]
MITSAIIRNYKNFKNINYISLSNGNNFSALIGENGVGKSSLLSAINDFLNKHDIDDIDVNYETRNKGYAGREPYITLLFMIKKSELPRDSQLKKCFSVISDITNQIESEDFNSSQIKFATQFCEHRETLFKNLNKNEYYLIPIGLIKREPKKQSELFLGIFDSIPDYEQRIKDESGYENKESALKDVYEKIKSSYDYLYIPSDIEISEYSRLESNTLQFLLGQQLENTIKEIVDDVFIKNINEDLNAYLNTLSEQLNKYKFKRPSKRQSQFNRSHLSQKIIETYFSDKTLSYCEDGVNLVPVSHLSSGEKRKALIDVIKSFLNLNINTLFKTTIIAIDEPEISLHASSCFEQFEKLENIAEKGIQTIITTHWYGFMPVVSKGSATYISPSNETALLDLKRFREDIRAIKVKTQGKMPDTIEVKGIHDLVQSILLSITNGNSYKWIICEGSSDKLYFDKYLEGHDVRVLAVGGSPQVKKIYEYLNLAIDSDSNSVKGAALFIVDTDERTSNDRVNAPRTKNINIKRLINTNYETELIDINSDITNPPTEIEDCLDARLFIETLIQQSIETDAIYHVIPDLLKNMDPSKPSGLAFDYRQTQRNVMNEFFSIPGKKVDFATAYIKSVTPSNELPWFNHVFKLLNL